MDSEPRFFTSEYEHTVDSGNRFILPSKWRSGEEDRFYLSPSDDGCLTALPVAEVARINQKIDEAPDMSERERQRRKMDIFSEAELITCDRQGRFTIPSEIMKRAGIKDGVTFVGKGPRFDLWSAKAWQKYKAESIAARRATRAQFGI